MKAIVTECVGAPLGIGVEQKEFADDNILVLLLMLLPSVISAAAIFGKGLAEFLLFLLFLLRVGGISEVFPRSTRNSNGFGSSN